MGESGGVWARVRALPVGAQVVLAGWSLAAVISVPLVLAGGSDQTVVTAAAGSRVTSEAAPSTSTAQPRTAATLATTTPAPPLTTTSAPPTTAPATTAPATTAPPPPATPPPSAAQAPTTAVPTTVPPTSVAPPTIASAPATDGCHPSYDPCVPVASDVDCAGGKGNGPAYVEGPVTVLAGDPYGLDADDDGIGCED